ncbi:MAG TPA: hypothetical protein PKK23_13935 [Nitrospirales bacterium]|nr:hypothetical protein [Nitrospirales bacterium]
MAWRIGKTRNLAIIGMLCVMVVGLQSYNVAGKTIGRHAKNMSFHSLCAEEDNVNIPIYGGYVSDYEITATFPAYYPLQRGQKDLCISDLSNCEQSWDMRPTAQIAYYDAAQRKLKFVWQSPGFYWYPVETPDAVNADVGEYVSLAYPPTDRYWVGLGAPPAMAYYDALKQNLMYIVRDEKGKWREPEIVDSTGDVGQYVSLRISRDRRHHIVYYDADHGDLKYTYKSNPDMVGGWVTPTILDANGDVGRHAAMAIGPGGSLHVVYYDADTKDLKYVTNDDAHGWSEPVVLDAVGDVGTYPSISVYYEGWTEKMNGAYEGHYPHVTYYDASNGNLKYIFRNEQGWSTPVVLDAEGDVGQYTSTAFGPDGALHVAYYDATNKDLKYLHKEAAAPWSSAEVLDAAGDVGRFASLGVSARGYPNIAYYDADNQSLKFLSKTKTTAPQWDKVQVIASGAAGQYASLVTSGFVDIADLDGWELYNDGDVAVRVMDVSGWPYESGMSVHILGEELKPDHDFIQFLKRTDDEQDFPQIFVLYANGYARIITQPPARREERVCFGSSMIIGPAAEDPLFPFIPIERLDIDPHTMTIKVRYKNGSSAVIHLQAERGKTTVRVTDVTYDTVTAPFVTMRSMYVADDNSDIARVKVASSPGVIKTYPIDPKREEWKTLPGDSWFFYRPTYSRHNSSCPDFKIDVLGPKGYFVTKQAEDYRSGTLVKTPRETASGGQTVRETGKANYLLNLSEDIPNPSIRLRYTKGNSAGDVVHISVDGRRQSTIEMVGEGSLGNYDVTQEMRLLNGLPAGSHTLTLEMQSDASELELDYFVIHNGVEHSSR